MVAVRDGGDAGCGPGDRVRRILDAGEFSGIGIELRGGHGVELRERGVDVTAESRIDEDAGGTWVVRIEGVGRQGRGLTGGLGDGECADGGGIVVADVEVLVAGVDDQVDGENASGEGAVGQRLESASGEDAIGDELVLDAVSGVEEAAGYIDGYTGRSGAG